MQMQTDSIDYDCRIIRELEEVTEYTIVEDPRGQDGERTYWDDLSGKALEFGRVRRAIQEEIVNWPNTLCTKRHS